MSVDSFEDSTSSHQDKDEENGDADQHGVGTVRTMWIQLYRLIQKQNKKAKKNKNDNDNENKRTT